MKKNLKQNTYRLFFTLDLSPSIKTELLEQQYKISQLSGIPVAAENFHITLSFLNNVDERKLQQIIEQISFENISPFNLNTGNLIYWKKEEIVALEIIDKANHLSSLKKQIEKQLASLNIFHHEKNNYQPHITLFRNCEFLASQSIKFSSYLSIDNISLMHSKNYSSSTKKQSQYYETIENWELQPINIKQHLLGQ